MSSALLSMIHQQSVKNDSQGILLK